MRLFLLLALIATSAFAEPQPCSGQFSIESSDEGGFVFSGNVTEGTYNSPRTSYHDDDGFLSLLATNAQILSSNNVYTGQVTNYRISDAEKNQIIRSLETQLSYNEFYLSQIGDASDLPRGAPTAEQVRTLTTEATEVLAFVRGVRTNVSADWNAKVGKYINRGLRANRVYQSLLPGISGSSYQMSLCGGLVRCLCDGNNSPFLRGRLCSINYESPAANTGEYARCSYFNVSVGGGSSSGGNRSQSNQTRTEQQ